MVGELNYGAGLDQDIITSMQKTILEFRVRYKDGYIGRQLIERRPGVASNVRKDIVRKIDKSTPQDGISTARISAGGTFPDIVGSKSKDVLHQIYRIDCAIQKNEAELDLDPGAWARDTSLAMLECARRENYTIINGDTTLGIEGIVGASAKNDLGTVTNAGAWDGSETDSVMDPYSDLLDAISLIDPNLIGQLYLAGRPAYMNYLLQEDDLGKIYADKLGGRIFGRVPGDLSWMIKSDYFPANYVYLILKGMESAELVIPEDYSVDANYPRQKGQNVYAEVGGWVGIEFHNYNTVVPIAIN